MSQRFKWVGPSAACPAAVLSISLLLAACGSGSGGSTDRTAPFVKETTPDSGAVMTTRDPVTISFNEAIDTGSLVLGGDMASKSDGGSFSRPAKSAPASGIRAEASSDTLTVNPLIAWDPGTDRSLTVDAKDIAGNSLPTLSLNFTIVKGMIYVSTPGHGGDDANEGTKAHPKATIPAGIEEATNQNYVPGAVLVSGGTYPVNSDPAVLTQVVLVEAISLYGGYSADFSGRNPSANLTDVHDMSTATATSGNPNRAIDAAGVTEATVVDGFTIQGAMGDYSTGILLRNGASPTIQNNMIHGGSGFPSFGILSFSSSPSIENNTINGGSGNPSFGIYADTSSPGIVDNTIKGGRGATSYGIYSTTSSADIMNNTIVAGSGNYSVGLYIEISSPNIVNNTISGGNGTISYGIFNYASSSRIENNTIDGGGGYNSYGILNSSTTPTALALRNNIIFTSGNGRTRLCIVEESAGNSDNPVSVLNNDLFDCPTAFYHDYESGNLTAIRDVNDLSHANGDIHAGGNASIDPAFEDRAGGDFHVTSSTPGEVTRGGLDLSADFKDDKDGVGRTVPWSIGAYERDK
jgi:Bacterial Ig-like domain